MQIYRIPVLRDNYIFLLHEPTQNIAAVVDPAIADPVLDKLRSLDAELVAILNTHHHSDHIGGNSTLLKQFPRATVYAGAEDQGRIPHQKVFLRGGDRFYFGDREVIVFFVPGHTYAHIAYYLPPSSQDLDQGIEQTGELFCGDTIFGGGCGRLFEGTPAQMLASIAQLRQLPDHTRLWCAHEYTLSNLKFAITVEPNNPDLQARFETVTAMRSRGEATIPSTIGIEKQTNPFLRWDVPAIQQAMGIDIPDRVFARLRGKKDIF